MLKLEKEYLRTPASPLFRRGASSMPGSSYLLAFLLSCFLVFTPAFAQSNDSAILAQLNSKDYHTRRDATRRLLQSATITANELHRLFLQASTPEQRNRMMDVIRHHTIRTLREKTFNDTGPAAIGFSHEVLSAGSVPDVQGGAVRVIATLPGFPGHAWFEPDDLIVRMDGKALPRSLSGDDFRVLLQQRQAGDSVSFTVMREDRSVHLKLKTVSAQALSQMYFDGPTLREPYLSQWAAVRDGLLSQAPAVPVLRVSGGDSTTSSHLKDGTGVN